MIHGCWNSISRELSKPNLRNGTNCSLSANEAAVRKPDNGNGHGYSRPLKNGAADGTTGRVVVVRAYNTSDS